MHNISERLARIYCGVLSIVICPRVCPFYYKYCKHILLSFPVGLLEKKVGAVLEWLADDRF